MSQLHREIVGRVVKCETCPIIKRHGMGRKEEIKIVYHLVATPAVALEAT